MLGCAKARAVQSHRLQPTSIWRGFMQSTFISDKVYYLFVVCGYNLFFPLFYLYLRAVGLRPKPPIKFVVCGLIYITEMK